MEYDARGQAADREDGGLRYGVRATRCHGETITGYRRSDSSVALKIDRGAIHSFQTRRPRKACASPLLDKADAVIDVLRGPRCMLPFQKEDHNSRAMRIQSALEHFSQFLFRYAESAAIQGAQRMWTWANDNRLLLPRFNTERVSPRVSFVRRCNPLRRRAAFPSAHLIVSIETGMSDSQRE